MLVATIALTMAGTQFKVNSTLPKRLLKSAYYIPFEFETYLPVTRDTIGSQGTEVSKRLQSKEEMLLKVLQPQGRAAKIDSKRIRLKVVTAKGDIIYLDADFVAMTGSRQFHLTDRNQAVIDAMFYREWVTFGKD